MRNNGVKYFMKQAGMVLILTAVYLVVAIPFKVMSIIPGFTDIRPVLMLNPIYGIFFGIPGCIAFAIGNLIGDLLSDSIRWSSIAGFAANFIGPLLFYIYWNKISKTPFSLRTGKNLLKQTVVTIFTAVIEAMIITPVVELSYPEVNSTLFALSVLLNVSVFPIFLGIPMMILMQDELHFIPKEFSKAKANNRGQS